MSIAINPHHGHAPARQLTQTFHAEPIALSCSEQLREGRALMRHFVLASLAAGVVLYAVLATSITL
jgi:hypothetical protein